MSAGAATSDTAVQQTHAATIRVRVDALKPFLDDTQRPIGFGDLQAAFGLDFYAMRKAVRVLRFAQLLDRRTAGRDPTPLYLLTQMTVTLLTPLARPKLSRAKTMECVNEAMDVAAAHNAAHALARVTAVAVKGPMLDAGVDIHESLHLEVIVAVKPVDTLVQDVDHLIRGLRRIHDRSLRVSLVLELPCGTGDRTRSRHRRCAARPYKVSTKTSAEKEGTTIARSSFF